MRQLNLNERKLFAGFIAWAQREDGDRSANDPDRYIVAEELPSGMASVVWGPGGVIVWLEAEGMYSWADDLDDADRYYTDEYRRAFP